VFLSQGSFSYQRLIAGTVVWGSRAVCRNYSAAPHHAQEILNFLAGIQSGKGTSLAGVLTLVRGSVLCFPKP